MKLLKFSAFPKSPIQITGWISEIISWYGFVYHFLRSLSVRAHRPCRGLVFSFGFGLAVSVWVPAAGVSSFRVGSSLVAASFVACSFSTTSILSGYDLALRIVIL